MKTHLLNRLAATLIIAISTVCIAGRASAGNIPLHPRVEKVTVDKSAKVVKVKGRMFSDSKATQPLNRAGMPLASNIKKSSGQKVTDLPRVYTDNQGRFTIVAPFRYFVPGASKYGTSYKVPIHAEKVQGFHPSSFVDLEVKVMPNGEITAQ